MKFQTDYGKVQVLSREQIFQRKIEILNELCTNKEGDLRVGLTGGSTPKEFYEWAVATNAFSKNLLNQIVWMTSDERYVPLESDESNFGNADRLLLTPLNVPNNRKHPWKVNLTPEKAAADYNSQFTTEHSFDLCILGMGDDCHIASLFPKSPLIQENPAESFTSLEVPGKGTRLTITPNGLTRSSKILMLVTGKAKSRALKRVFEESFKPVDKPAQLNKEWHEKVFWLVDYEAASELSF